jgi:uncharacterized protein (DUF1778 family)
MRAARVKQHDPADERITARVPSSTRSIIERAAALYGSTINQFIVQAAVDRANEVIKDMEVIKLSAKASKIFMDALANPPKPNDELLEAVHAHRSMVESRD